MTSPDFPENRGSESLPPGADLWSQKAAPAGAAAVDTGWEREVLEKLVMATLSEQRAVTVLAPPHGADDRSTASCQPARVSGGDTGRARAAIADDR